VTPTRCATERIETALAWPVSNSQVGGGVEDFAVQLIARAARGAPAPAVRGVGAGGLSSG